MSGYAGAERQVIGVPTVPNWQPGMMPDVLPPVYRDIVEVVADAPVRAVVVDLSVPEEVERALGLPAHVDVLVNKAGARRARTGRRPQGGCRAVAAGLRQ